MLQEAFGSWHSPIPELIEASSAAAAAVSASQPIAAVPLLREQSGWLKCTATTTTEMGCYVGDARLSMPANLAQGAAMAIEEAAELAAALAEHGPGAAAVAACPVAVSD